MAQKEILPDIPDERLADTEQVKFVSSCVASIVEFSRDSRYSNFFENCKLYCVGSSLENGDYNDVDVVLVGLDYRAINKYDGVFLMDPKTLIEKKILTEPKMVILNGGGDEKILAPINQTIINHGVEYKGKRYDYAYNEMTTLERDYYLSYEAECVTHRSYTPLIVDLKEHVLKKTKSELKRGVSQYGGYDTEWFDFLVCDFMFIKEDNKLLKPVHFLIHSENLHTSSWEKLQTEYELPFMKIYEWPTSNTENPRPIITKMELPRFIDPEGHCRVKLDYEYLPGLIPEKIITRGKKLDED